MFDSPESAALWFNIFNGILFTGALLVTVGTWGTIKTAGIKERYSDERIAANEAETRRAIADSDTAKEGTAKTTERIAELSAQAEQLRKDSAEANARAAEANLALAKIKAPRTLTPDQYASLIAVMMPFADKQYDMAIVIGDPEATDILGQIDSALTAAGLIAVPWTPATIGYERKGRPRIGNTTVPGVIVQMHPDHLEEFSVPASLLVNELVEAGIAARAEFGLGIENNNPNAMHILIGKKPM